MYISVGGKAIAGCAVGVGAASFAVEAKVNLAFGAAIESAANVFSIPQASHGLDKTTMGATLGSICFKGKVITDKRLSGG